MSLITDLLENPDFAAAAITSQATNPEFVPTAPRAGTRVPVTESDVLRKIRASRGQRLSLREDETEVLARIIESDPFRNGPTFDVEDLSNLGLNVSDGEDEIENIGGGPARRDQGNEQLPDGMLSVDQCIMAPNATPGHDEPIPDSVLRAMDVISGGNEQPVPEKAFSGAPSTAGAGSKPSNQNMDAASLLVGMGGEGAEDEDDDFGVEQRIGEAQSTPSTRHGDAGIDPQQLAETMRRMRGQGRESAAPERSAPRRMSLEEIASQNRRSAPAAGKVDVSPALLAETAAKIRSLG